MVLTPLEMLPLVNIAAVVSPVLCVRLVTGLAITVAAPSASALSNTKARPWIHVTLRFRIR